MALHELKSKIYIEFDIIKKSNSEPLVKELQYLIGLNQFVILWSKKVSIEDMISYCITKGLSEYIWDYKQKDSFYYSSIDCIIDNNKKLVDMFLRNNKKANYLERIE